MMNVPFIIFYVLTSISVQATKKAELTINILDCRESIHTPYLAELKVLKDGQDYKILYPQHENVEVLKNLESGTYILIYKSMFGKEESLKVEINENKKYSQNLCVNSLDYSKETYIPIIDQLQEDSLYTIIVCSQGCFHFRRDTITISRNLDKYNIIWGTNSKELSKEDLNYIRHFEYELNYMNDFGCTTTDSYIIQHNNSDKIIQDGSCVWNGDTYLKKQLFGED